MAGGLLSLWTMAPLRTATAELSMHLSRTHISGEVAATATVLRRRRHGLVVTVEVADGSVQHPATTIEAVLGFGELTDTDDGAELSIVMGDEQRNTFGALNGGLLTAAMSRAAAAAPRSVLGPDTAVVQLTQAFLAPARGPRLAVTARVVGQPTPDLAVVEVSMIDPDQDGRQPALPA